MSVSVVLPISATMPASKMLWCSSSSITLGPISGVFVGTAVPTSAPLLLTTAVGLMTGAQIVESFIPVRASLW